MHVRISDKGRQIMGDKDLAYRLVETILGNKTRLEKGEAVLVSGSDIAVKFATTIQHDASKKA
jgi:hypothetical protein